MPGGTKNDPKLFIAISHDGLHITCTRSEMGQGIRTSLALVVADEMEADWEKCRVVQAEGDEEAPWESEYGWFPQHAALVRTDATMRGGGTSYVGTSGISWLGCRPRRRQGNEA